MPRKKQENEEEILSRNLIVRVSQQQFNRLEKLRRESGHQTIAEIVRRILSGKKLHLFYTDTTINAPMEELAGIRRELKAIGININQITRTFNTDKEGSQRQQYILQVASLYQKVDTKVERLLTLITKLAEKWLQG
ncbi:plasmid mobilization relaxosome protein MobC [Nubsella zeaxanthinifaciens]|uniref:plasmid mobilization relaxosome protein MobC n=1 Tax=Nubsella zeaxanthinifaciens TaxID=392412 RepID=UPI000DE4C0E6|nr:plasmid mobilization relaxosome protein MobC [Nubsella zeaxanthinifaciens]